MQQRSRALASLALVVVGACGGVTPRSSTELDAGVGSDGATSIDAARPMDAARDDGAVTDDDSGPSSDAAMTMADGSWGPCSFAGVSGVCLPTAECPAGSAPRPGLCPGPADIQCCLPLGDAGMSTGTITADEVRARLGACTRIGGDYASDVGDPETVPICQTGDVIWWTADMDIDCDGGRSALCMSDPDYLPDTSGVDSMGNPLDASALPFIVIPLASSRFRYADHGIRTGQVALVLYGDRMVYGIFGDAGPSGIIGEASFAMAEALGIPSDPRTGGVDSGVTYLVFTSAGARVAHNESHDEATTLGTALLSAFVP